MKYGVLFFLMVMQCSSVNADVSVRDPFHPMTAPMNIKNFKLTQLKLVGFLKDNNDAAAVIEAPHAYYFLLHQQACVDHGLMCVLTMDDGSVTFINQGAQKIKLILHKSVS